MNGSMLAGGKSPREVTIRTFDPTVKDINQHCGEVIESDQYRQKWSEWRTQRENDRQLKQVLFRILMRTRGFKSIYSTRRFFK